MTTKLCRKCDTVKQLSDFYKISGQNKHGVTSQCKICIQSRNKRNYVVYKSKHDDRIKLRNRKYQSRIKIIKNRDTLIPNMNYENIIHYVENHSKWNDATICEYLIANQLKPKLSFKEIIHLIEGYPIKNTNKAKIVPNQVKKVFDFITSNNIQNKCVDEIDYIEPDDDHIYGSYF